MTRGRKQNRSPLNTADHLARAVLEGRLPDHPQTREDYRFNRAVYVQDKRYLLCLYADLIKVKGVSPKTIHHWHVRGVLVDEIKAAFYNDPKYTWGSGNFPWFLQNEYNVALAGKPFSAEELRGHGDTMVLRSWRFTGGSERYSAEEVRAIIARKPVEEQKCHLLYTLLLCQWTPIPDSDQLWVEFGFASCTSKEEEWVLGGHYRQLITMCTFKEFCDAYRERRLLDLFHSKGLRVNSNAHLLEILCLPPCCRRSVWDLKQFVLEDGDPPRIHSFVLVDYGFINCTETSHLRQLKKVYMDFFNNHHGDPLALHEAAMQGNLYGFLSNIVPGVQGRKFQRLMRNPYPLPDVKFDVTRSWLSTWLNTPTLVLGAGLGGVLLGMFWMR